MNIIDSINLEKKEVPVMHVSDYLRLFWPIINSLLAGRETCWQQPVNNIVIGGSHALKLHGIILPRPPQDLDLVIYQPTKTQLDYIESIRLFHLGSYNEDLSIICCKSFMFKKRGLLLNVVLEQQEGVAKPDCELLFKFENNLFEVQSVENVIIAKNEYRLNPHTTTVTGMRYIRAKDAVDCMEMKNLNFNIPLTADTMPNTEDGSGI